MFRLYAALPVGLWQPHLGRHTCSNMLLFLHQKHKVDLFYKVRHVMLELMDLRRQLLSGHLTQDQSRDVKRHATVRLDWGNE